MNSPDAPAEFFLSPVLVSQGYALRPESEDDLPFLFALYASTREEELQAVGWTDEQKHSFLRMQFAAQRQHYRTHLAGCHWLILEANGEPAGRLYLDVRPSRFHVVDISLLPSWRRKGVGTAILEALKQAAGASGRGVGIMVEKFNPALNLYRRLGFVEVADRGVYLEMEWPTERGQLNSA